MRPGLPEVSGREKSFVVKIYLFLKVNLDESGQMAEVYHAEE